MLDDPNQTENQVEEESSGSLLHLLDSEGISHSFRVIDALSIDEKDYMLLYPLSEEDSNLLNLENPQFKDDDYPGYFAVRLETDDAGEDCLREVTDPRELEDLEAELDTDIL